MVTRTLGVWNLCDGRRSTKLGERPMSATWSAKQVRAHFERLRRSGMITAEREHDNGPWQYELPEELTSRSSVFRGLPRPG